jgi:hypothetical protein
MVHYTAEIAEIKNNIINTIETQVDALLGIAATPQPESGSRDLETACWRILAFVGRAVLTAMLTVRCRTVAGADIQRRGLSPNEVAFRFDEGHVASVTTTLGPLDVPLFAYRERGSKKTRNPARPVVFPLLPRCHSSDLLLEWETRLGAAHPFRLAQDELGFFTHNAVSLEDTTIARHMKAAAGSVSRSWLYRTKEGIREALRTRATRDGADGRPIVYMASDAHALRRFVDETWDAPWKMANGLRIWCEDKDSGEIIHLGGEYTWGDCNHVNSIFKDLIGLGIVPRDGDYGDGVLAKLVWLSDGARWFEEHILPLFAADAVDVILDAYHLLEAFGECGRAVFGNKSAAGAAWFARGAKEVAGKAPASEEHRAAPRKGHKKTPGGRRHVRVIPTGATEPEPDHTPKRLLDLIAEVDNAANSDAERTAVNHLRAYVVGNAYRINYARYRYRGLAIGSGAMESLHRIASQLRLKRPGLRACAETSQAIFTWRMLLLVDRWDEFWAQPNLARHLAETWRDSPINYQLPEAA